MQIDKRYRLEKAVSTDPGRANLHNIWISRRHGFSTNGKILAVVPVTQEKDDTPGWLTPESLKLARRALKGSDTIVINLNGQIGLPGGVTVPRPTESRFPNVFRLLRSAHNGRDLKIGLNVDQLKGLADSIGSDEITLELGKSDEVILVRPLHDSNLACGLIMPICINEKRRN